ncbi:type II toxin-antitoxin system HipA family toxin YjjJ [Variovorax sp. 770b2]|uniref:type II toxin-antitoxin system HipA family toxin YjjJ n=1 Tax=Variovorax sp. 770b2 TaxID=1566271 RepID=UPI0008E0F840|nr:type II toxin-antitoxin system HipA family toxin YjjJ [Variovorax sp. 770b2]SFQ34842.1 HipA-like C-terminal domain-containing protein [Variovorax sp. 770b2]
MAADPVGILRAKGPIQAGELADAMGVSRPTLSRAIRAAGAGVIVRGNARRTKYAARRALRGDSDPIPLFRIDRLGTQHQVALLDLVYPDGTAAEFSEEIGWPLDDEMKQGWFEGLPYMMQDMRPQGFLGRNFARHHGALLKVSDDPANWSDDDVLYALSLLGSDAPGDLLVGEAAARKWLEQVQALNDRAGPHGIADDQLVQSYPRLAAQALELGVAGSSAGGEFPKFTAMRSTAESNKHVLVKFSGSDDSPGTRRWADLLVCEHLAAQALAERAGIDVAKSRVLILANRTFLEVDRFDRHGAIGRSPVVSWSTLNSTFVGAGGRPWVEGVRPLAKMGWITDDDLGRIGLLGHFGQLIGNSDMHDGNLSFQPVKVGDQAKLQLAPIYDMLPMTYAPVRGVELPPRTYAPRLPLPSEKERWKRVAVAAVAFWDSAAADDRISAEFRAVCAQNSRTLQKTRGT